MELPERVELPELREEILDLAVLQKKFLPFRQDVSSKHLRGKLITENPSTVFITVISNGSVFLPAHREI